jgi:hypothetical protein
MEVKLPENEVKAKFSQLKEFKKMADLRTIDSTYIIKAVEAKLKEIKGI